MEHPWSQPQQRCFLSLTVRSSSPRALSVKRPVFRAFFCLQNSETARVVPVRRMAVVLQFQSAVGEKLEFSPGGRFWYLTMSVLKMVLESIVRDCSPFAATH